jgi:hypothetical protein
LCTMLDTYNSCSSKCMLLNYVGGASLIKQTIT